MKRGGNFSIQGKGSSGGTIGDFFLGIFRIENKGFVVENKTEVGSYHLLAKQTCKIAENI